MVRRVLTLTSGRIAVVILTVIALLAILGPLLAPQDPLTTGTDTLAHASGAHWLGTDYLGRDVLVSFSTAPGSACWARSK